MEPEQVEGMAMMYESPEDIELYPALLAERALPGAALGPTLACLMASQLLRWRRADRFWYENTVHPGAFTEEQLLEIRKATLSRIICDHGEEVHEIQPNAFLLAGHGNEMTECANIPFPNLNVWTDASCARKQYTHQKTLFTPDHVDSYFDW
ncbi:hypothetical protein O3G_MSEX015380 [Manduca sexta]|uniref:Peroxidase n=2 Tax=Manduca sexta TaxID=7130 RepID=A0A922D1W5_MANSE|nr:hypothetical protein O3G_MSEX015380 [Manduca sexta]